MGLVQFVILLPLLLTALAAASSAVYDAVSRRWNTAGSRPRSAPDGTSRAALRTFEPPRPDDERVEAIVTSWLLTGALSRDEYRQEMAALAERDALRRPFLAPPDHDG